MRIGQLHHSSLSIIYIDNMMCHDCILLVEVKSDFLSDFSAQGFLTVNEPQWTSLRYVETSSDMTEME